MNRITARANELRKRIKMGGVNGALDTAEKIKAFDEAQNITFQEHFAYQNTQSRLYAMGKLTLEEAQAVYQALGEGGSQSNGGWAAHTDLAMKITVIQLMGEVMLGGKR